MAKLARRISKGARRLGKRTKQGAKLHRTWYVARLELLEVQDSLDIQERRITHLSKKVAKAKTSLTAATQAGFDKGHSDRRLKKFYMAEARLKHATTLLRRARDEAKRDEFRMSGAKLRVKKASDAMKNNK